jgi:hypothetical protein
MFTPQKFAAVSGLVTSLAAICLGASHAYAAGADCTTTTQGDTVCIRKSETHVEKDGTNVIKQTQDCSTTDRPQVVDPQGELLDGGSASVGPVVECSNTATLPKDFNKDFRKPHIGF